ncbi:MAG: HEAT repeat domain-containing protein [Saprospiraceae bacterium]
MNETDITSLIEKYHAGILSHDEWKSLEAAISTGACDLNALPMLGTLQVGLSKLTDEDTPSKIRTNVMDMIQKEISKEPKVIQLNREWIIRGLMTAAAMFIGLIIGFVIPGKSSIAKDDVVKLKTEMHSLKETMMLTLLKKDDVSERLKAVSYTFEMDQSSKKVIDALFYTLNEDNNINVRLAAVDALQQYGQESSVRERLVKSIGKQGSPLVQVALAESMVTLKVKSSIDALQKIINNDQTPDPVKNKLKGCIQQII